MESSRRDGFTEYRLVLYTAALTPQKTHEDPEKSFLKSFFCLVVVLRVLGRRERWQLGERRDALLEPRDAVVAVAGTAHNML